MFVYICMHVYNSVIFLLVNSFAKFICILINHFQGNSTGFVLLSTNILLQMDL